MSSTPEPNRAAMTAGEIALTRGTARATGWSVGTTQPVRFGGRDVGEQPLHAHVNLEKGERSALANLASELL